MNRLGNLVAQYLFVVLSAACIAYALLVASSGFTSFIGSFFVAIFLAMLFSVGPVLGVLCLQLTHKHRLWIAIAATVCANLLVSMVDASNVVLDASVSQSDRYADSIFSSSLMLSLTYSALLAGVLMLSNYLWQRRQ